MAVKGKKAVEPKVDLGEGIEQDQDQENTVQDAQHIKRRHQGPWVRLHKDKKENEKLLIRHSKAGNLKGHDPKTGEVILNDDDFVLPEEQPEAEVAAEGKE